MFKVSKVDEAIEKISIRIIADSNKSKNGKVLAKEIKALAELLSARVKYD